jgi:ParB family transcriptional regulator, chromosome partitioning protein
MPKPALGRGLSALLGDSGPPPAASQTTPAPAAQPESIGDAIERVPLDRVRPCPFQPRKDFPDDAIDELADSIKAQGIIQPLVVRQQGDVYELIAGERRWRAAREAGLFEIPVIVREADDRTVLELALVENLQRENLNPIEEALGYTELARQFDLTQEAIAIKVGKSRAAVANALRLLKLAPEAQSHLRHNRISAGHAKVILGLTSHEQQLLAVERVLRESLNVRQTERLVSELQTSSGKEKPAGGGTSTYVRDAHINDMEGRLQEHLGTKVLLRYRKGKGAVEIRFFSDEELERVIEVLGIKTD